MERVQTTTELRHQDNSEAVCPQQLNTWQLRKWLNVQISKKSCFRWYVDGCNGCSLLADISIKQWRAFIDMLYFFTDAKHAAVNQYVDLCLWA